MFKNKSVTTLKRRQCAIDLKLGGAAVEWKQESRAVARKPRNAAAVLFSLKFVDIIHYKFNISQASKARLQSSKRTGANRI